MQENIAARDQTIGTWLESLASSTPAPGGGAATALNAAVGAALIEMACNLTIGRPRYAQHEAEMRAVLAEATELRNRAMRLAADDARAYGDVSRAYTLPRETDAQRQVRTEQLRLSAGVAPCLLALTLAPNVSLDVFRAVPHHLPGGPGVVRSRALVPALLSLARGGLLAGGSSPR